jgi:hypothetical protein
MTKRVLACAVTASAVIVLWVAPAAAGIRNL